LEVAADPTIDGSSFPQGFFLLGQEPANLAVPNAKTPPSAATNLYPVVYRGCFAADGLPGVTVPLPGVDVPAGEMVTVTLA
jgi:hypothetical protein